MKLKNMVCLQTILTNSAVCSYYIPVVLASGSQVCMMELNKFLFIFVNSKYGVTRLNSKIEHGKRSMLFLEYITS